MIIAFDFDGVFVKYPLFLPPFLRQFIYREKKSLSERFPTFIEQKLRIFSHILLFRKPIQKNINSVRNNNRKSEMYLISGRYQFLNQKTNIWLKAHHLEKIFKRVFINSQNEQPFLFKDKKIRELRVERFVDDDIDLIEFLAKKHPDTIFFWINQEKNEKIAKNIMAITDLDDVFKKRTIK